MDLVDAIVDQQRRRHRLDDRLPVTGRDSLAGWLADHHLRSAIRVEARHGEIMALGCASVEHHDADSDKLAYYQADTGTAPILAVRSDDRAGRAALGRTLKRLEADWIAGGASGANILWPSRDIDVTATLAGCGFRPDAYLAYQPAAALRRNTGPATPAGRHAGHVVRPAVAADEPVLLRLQEEVLSAHIPNSPFARRVPGVTARFRQRLAAGWAGRSPTDGACLVTVVEEAGEVVGMSECFLTRHHPALDTLLPEGRYGYVNTFGLLPHRRGNGLGRLLAAAVTARLLGFGVRGVYLYYSHYNPGAGAFWRRLGYDPLWDTYQRHGLMPTTGPTERPQSPAGR